MWSLLGWVDHYRQQMENSAVTAATKQHHLFDMERKLEVTITENTMLREANAKLKVCEILDKLQKNIVVQHRKKVENM